MKRYIVLIYILLLFNGCLYREVVYVERDIIPPAPQGIETITGDEEVYIDWLPVEVPDISYYKIYRSDGCDNNYYLIATTSLTHYIDTNLENGVTYYYAISSVSTDGLESPLSTEYVHDTPRPEGWDICLYDAYYYPDYGAMDVVYGEVVPTDCPYAGIIFYSVNGIYYLESVNDVWIQDMGYTESFDDISVAPYDGWSRNDVVECIEGHTYVMWTPENLFAKIRVSYIGSNYMICDWGCQIDPGNPEIKR